MRTCNGPEEPPMFRTRKLMKKKLLPTLLTILLMSNLVPSAHAQGEPSAPGITVATSEEGVSISWNASTVEVSAATIDALLPTAHYQGYDLPIQSVTLALPAGFAASIVVQRLETVPFAGALVPSATTQPPALDWTPASNADAPEPAALPTAPIFVLREGTVRGHQIAVLAISPIFEQNGAVWLATALETTVPGAVLTSDLIGTARYSGTAPKETLSVPINDAALKNSYKITVNTAGIQEIHFDAIGGVPNPNTLRLTHRGQDVAIQVLADRLRFYAPSVGDRWNTTSLYWLVKEDGGLRMATSSVTPSAVPGQAFERGTWRDNKVYDSLTPGADSDHWFNTAMTALPDAPPSALPAALIPIAPGLPTVTGQGIYTASVSVTSQIPTQYCQSGAQSYKLRFDALDSASTVLNSQTTAWNPATFNDNRCQIQENWDIAWNTAAVPTKVRLTLLASGLPGYQTSIRLDSMHWKRPVALSFADRGGEFWTPAGAWSYTMAGTRPTDVLYDVSDPLAPSIVALANQSHFSQDHSTERHYVLADTTDLAQPSVLAHSPVNFGDVKAADAIYIGPIQFRTGLQPLLTLRSNQGHTPLFVDVQNIYDAYSHGYISAPAIRNFLRDQTDWQNTDRTISVVLVGDGTYDPYNYEAKVVSGRTFAIPPYMADVDTYINETSCEPCFAQLHGEDPVTGDEPQATNPKSNFFAADIWLGRFPVRTESELANMVNKIVAYEASSSSLTGWTARHLFLADNFIRSINTDNEASIDPAGDFAAYSDALVAAFGYGVYTQRIYYDPAPTRQVDFNGTASSSLYPTVARSPAEPWRTSSPAAARQGTIEQINNGVGLMVYNGHSNHWQYAILESPSGDTPLLSIADVGLLSNTNKPFVGLSMTCYTSAFARPANEGTLDELFVRKANGGAVAMWGPAGLTVAHGHDYLQKGFITQLRTSAPASQRLGSLVEAGYTSLLTSPLTGSLDALKTFLVLGDPLTTMHLISGGDEPLFLPIVRR